MNPQIDILLSTYYTALYRDELRLPDWEAHVAKRQHEEARADSILQKFEFWTDHPLPTSSRVLVVGGGTGAEFMAFVRWGCEVYAIEPNPQAVTIGQMKAQALNYPPERFMQGIGEALPFKDKHFDLVWCWTVLEHVQDVRQTVHEMVRVTRAGGTIFIHTPNYRQFYEPHYKITLPMFAPKILLKLWLKLIGCPTAFFDTLQFVTSKQLTLLFQSLPVDALYIISANPPLSKQTLQTYLVDGLRRLAAIQRDQYWILRKHKESHS